MSIEKITLPRLATPGLPNTDPITSRTQKVLSSKMTARKRFRALRNLILGAAALRSRDFSESASAVEVAFENMPRVLEIVSPKNNKLSKSPQHSTSASPRDRSLSTGGGSGVGGVQLSKRQHAMVREMTQQWEATRKQKEVNDEDKVEKMIIPALCDLDNFPPILHDTFRSLAMEKIRRTFYPKLLLLRRVKQRSKANRALIKTTPKPIVSDLRRIKLFERWDESLLGTIIDGLQLSSYDPGQMILYEGEPYSSGMVLLVKGTVDIMKRKFVKGPGYSKKINGANCKVLGQLTAPVCLGEFALLTEEPRMASIVCVTKCVAWVVNKTLFADVLSRVPRNVMVDISSIAFEKRNANMALSFPMTVQMMRQYPLFRACSELMLQEMIHSLIPHALPKNYVVCEAEELSHCMYFLRNGLLGVFRTIDGQPILVQRLGPGALIGQESAIHSAPYGKTVRTLKNCDMWKLTSSSMEMALRGDPTIVERMMNEARMQRSSTLLEQRSRYRDWGIRIPLLAALIPKSKLHDIILLFEPKVYRPMSVMCSTAHFCNKLIFLTAGNVRVGTNGKFERGECIGYTCVLPHRWNDIVMSLNVVECLELDVKTFEAFLADCGVLDKVRGIVKKLLFPLAYPSEEVAQAEALLANVKTPWLHPRSTEEKINFLQPQYFPERLAFNTRLSTEKTTTPPQSPRATMAKNGAKAKSKPTKLMPLNVAFKGISENDKAESPSPTNASSLGGKAGGGVPAPISSSSSPTSISALKPLRRAYSLPPAERRTLLDTKGVKALPTRLRDWTKASKSMWMKERPVLGPLKS
eukprot:PhF_6_TR37584/c0_g1_i2/m.55762